MTAQPTTQPNLSESLKPMDLSIVIPAYNRVELLKRTLQSVKSAIKNLRAEVLIVDDGSDECIYDHIDNYLNLPLRVLRQTNQGSAVAKHYGIMHCQGKYIQVLDSDDIVHEDKFIIQIAQLEESQSDVSYTDFVVAEFESQSGELVYKSFIELPTEIRPEELYLKIHPIPHSPIFRRAYLQKHLESPLIPATKEFGPVGDAWVYYNLSIYPAKISKLSCYHTIYIKHSSGNYSANWHRMEDADLALKTAFIKNCPKTKLTHRAHVIVGEHAFMKWQIAPRHAGAAYRRAMLDIWRQSPRGRLDALGGGAFSLLTKIVGVESAAEMIRYSRMLRGQI